MADDDDNPLLQPPTGSEIRRISGETPLSERATQPAVPPDVAGAPPAMRMGKFIRVAKVGAGGMGEVWKAWDGDLGRWVALKILKSSDEEEAVRFAREAHIAGKLSHPYIAQIYEIGEDQGRRFIAMQFIDGLTLRALARGDGVRLVRLISDAARAVAYAHGQGVIHRDIKPENLMVRQHAKDLHLYVMDFGLARSISSDARLSLSGTVVGTPAYMPPEQARGQAVDERADVYSLGATLYELLARRPPFVGKDLFDILQKVQNDEPPPLPRVAPDLVTVIFKCLEKDPAHRYASAGELADDLDRWMRSEPVLASRPSIPYRLSKWLKRRVAIVIPSVAALLLAAGIGAWLVKQSLDRRHAGKDARAQERAGNLEGARDAYLRAGLAADADRLGAVLAQRRRDVEAKDQALKDLENARRILDEATSVLYSRDAPLDDLRRLAEQAIARIRAVLERAPRLPLAHYLLGLAHELRDEDDEAEAAWRTAIELDPSFSAARMRLAKLLFDRVYLARSYEQETGPEKARVASEKIAMEAHRLLASAKLDDELQDKLAAALIALSQDEFDEAYRVAKAGAVDRRGAEDLLWIGGVMSRDLRESMALFDRALAIRPKFPLALLARAWTRRLSSDFDGAERDLDEALRLRPRFYGALMNRGFLRMRRRDLTGAVSDYQEATKIQPLRGIAWTNLGTVRVQAGDRSHAAADFREAIRVQPDFAMAHFQLGCTLKLDGDVDGAVREWSETIRLKPDHADARINRGNAYMASLDYARAAADYEAAAKAEPANPEPLLYQSHALALLGDRDGAIRALEKALEAGGPAWEHRQRVQQMIEQLKQ